MPRRVSCKVPEGFAYYGVQPLAYDAAVRSLINPRQSAPVAYSESPLNVAQRGRWDAARLRQAGPLPRRLVSVQVLDPEPLCTGRLLELMQWMSRYYLAPLGQVFEAAVPASVLADTT